MSLARPTAVILVALVAIATAVAAAPQVISFQGRLTDDTGAPLPDGAKSIRFIIWNDPTSTLPANERWNSGPATVTTVDGLFTVNLGEPPMTALPPAVFADTNLWIGITVGAEPEGTPRIKITSSAFAFRALYADTALYAPMTGVDHGSLMGLGDDDHPQYFLANGSRSLSGNVDVGYHQVRNLAPATAASDAIRYDQAMKSGEAAGGDLTGTYPSPGLATGSVGSAEVANGAITNEDINASAAIAVTKIAGTACNLSSAQTLTGRKTFSDGFLVEDSTLFAYGGSVLIGSMATPWTTALVRISRQFSISGVAVHGMYGEVTNNGSGSMYGLRQTASSNSTGSVYGGHFKAEGAAPHAGYRYGLFGQAGSVDNTAGRSYGVAGYAYGGDYAYGVYGRAEYGTTSCYAGYFYGDARVTGTLSKSAGSFKIDHPLDPENKYLQHSFVESPDMMNIYNGNITTDANGVAVVTLPHYFEALNRDFRYQLTVIGKFAQAVVGEEVNGGRFTILTDEPNVKVSWQVTGIRKDRYAETNRIEVEVDKPAHERGYYQNPEVYGMGIERSIDRENLIEAKERAGDQDR